MGNHFYGSAVSEHYEKDIKDLTPLDWVLVVIFFTFGIGAFVFGFMKHFGIMVALLGAAACMGYPILRVVFQKKHVATLIFIVLGILAIIAGFIVEAERWDIFPYYVVSVFMLIAFGVAVICIRIKVKNSQKLKAYSLSVEAVCEMVDIKRINLFRFDDLPNMPYTAPINKNTLFKPGFHYVVNGQEYFTESTVYYGDMNRGFVEGNHVLLKVNPDNPNEILPVDADSTVANMAMVMGVFWIVGGIVGIVVLILMMNGVIRF